MFQFQLRPESPAWRRLIAAVALLIVFMFIFPTVERYAAIWDARANPKPDVDVRLQSTKTVRGELSRTWEGAYELKDRHGDIHIFGTDQFAEMVFPMPSTHDREHALIKHWRAYAPPMMLSGAIIFALLAAGASSMIGAKRD